MGWVVRFSDDAWGQYDALSAPVQEKLRQILFSEWVEDGPKADGVRLINGVLFREAEFTFGVRISWLVPSESSQDILVIKIRPMP